MAKKVIAVPDLHFPWHDPECLTWIYDVIRDTQPDVVVQLGDLYDMYSASKFAKTHNLMTPAMELAEARLGGEAFWANVKKAAPNAKCFQILGNHDIRPNKRILEVCPELESLLSTHELYKFKGVETILDPKEELEIDGVLYTHGSFSKAGDHCKHYRQPVVFGHLHRGFTFFTTVKDDLLWELNCGYASDQTAVPLRYTATKRTGWTLGCGLIDDGGPRFLPYPGNVKK